MDSLGLIYDKLKNNKFLKILLVKTAHLMGIWEPVDYIKIGRKADSRRGWLGFWYQIKKRRIGCLLRLEIPNFNNIGDNFTLCHASSIVIHSDAIIGNSCTIYKGVSVGSVRSGKRAGVPIIEDNVCIHANSVVAGGITVGHDTLIAADTFVDFDVPPHSLVIGNPAVIKHKEYASKDYIITE